MRRPVRLLAAAVIAAVIASGATVAPTTSANASQRAAGGSRAAVVPRFEHVVIAIMENRGYSQIIGSRNAPYINALSKQGANLTAAYAETHPSQPNYLAFFSGGTQGIADDSCPHTFSTPNLARSMLDANLTFAGYSEGMPSDGYTGCTSGTYARKHNPWVNWSNVPPDVNLTYESFPRDYSRLPTVSFVIPDMCHDMHDCSIRTGDTWLKENLDGYAQWAKTHNSLLLLTFDEDNRFEGNRIPAVFVGAGVRTGNFGTCVNHYNMLRTLEDMYGLHALGASASAPAITEIWRPSGTPSAGVREHPRRQGARIDWINV